MSVQATTWVWEHSDTTGSERLLLLAIADAANRTGEHAIQSVPSLVRITRLSEPSVKRLLAKLRTDGRLEKTGDAGPRYSFASVYRIIGVREGYQDETPSKPEGYQTSARGVSPGTKRGITGEALPQETYPKVLPQSSDKSNETELALELSPSLRVVPEPDCTDEWFETWWSEWPRGKRKVGKSKTLVKYRLALTRGATPELLLEALRRWIPEWARENDRYVPQPVRWFTDERWREESWPTRSEPLDWDEWAGR